VSVDGVTMTAVSGPDRGGGVVAESAEGAPRRRPPSRAWAALVAVLAAGAAVLGWWLYRELAPDVPIVDLELAGSRSAATEVLDRTDIDDVRAALDADWWLIGGYVAGLLLAVWLGVRVSWTSRARRLVVAAGVAAVSAGVADVVENVLLYGALDPVAGDWTWRWIQAAAFTKFTLLGVAVPIAATAWAFAAGRLLNSWRRPSTVDIAKAIPPPALAAEGDGQAADGAAPDGRRRRVAADARWLAAGARPPGRHPAEVGICASGGGIRSACVTLGALQALREAGQLSRAGYLVSVSGGGYMTGAFQLALQPERDADARPTPDPNRATPADALAAGTVEEDHLRRHSRYVADSVREWLAALAVLLRGVIMSLLLIALTVAVAGLALSAFYRLVSIVDVEALRPRFVLGADPPDAPPFPWPARGVRLSILLTAAGALVAYLLTVVVLSWSGRSSRRDRRPVLLAGWLLAAAAALAAVAAVLAVAGVGVPALVWASARVTWWPAAEGGPVSAPASGAVFTVLMAYLGTLAGVLWRKRETIGTQVGRLRSMFGGAGAGTARAVPTSLVQRLIVGLALVAITLGFLLVLGWVVSTAPDWPWWAPVVVIAALAFCAIFLDQTWLGLHPFYRRRLATAFAVRRATLPGGQVAAVPYDFANETTTLSEYARRPAGGSFPKVIFAAAANLSGPERTPPGRRAVSFTFADDYVGGPDVGWVSTAELERVASGHLQRDLTVQAAVAISGAAFASAMGRQARAFQTFLALSNARLGAWLPNPAFLAASAAAGGDWTRPGLPRLRRLSYLLREIGGSYPCDDRLLFCTDGGHYENLGLVELLRHGCRVVYCIDASGDSPPLATTLGEAIMLAREELGITIELATPRDLVPGGGDPLDPKDPLAALNGRLSRGAVCVGRIRYPRPLRFADGTAGQDGVLVVAKATITGDMPYELLSYAARHPVFPRDSTSDQWFDHGQFNAYHALGRFVGARAAAAGRVAEAALDAAWWQAVWPFPARRQ
jgi:hypothetical protein